MYNLIGVRDCPYGICCPWVRGGWDLDALGKFFRRRRRRRRPRPLLFRQILEQSRQFHSFLMEITFWDICCLEGRFWAHDFIMSHPSPRTWNIFRGTNKSRQYGANLN